MDTAWEDIAPSRFAIHDYRYLTAGGRPWDFASLNKTRHYT
jgi:hypothetical protein